MAVVAALRRMQPRRRGMGIAQDTARTPMETVDLAAVAMARHCKREKAAGEPVA